jgi:hypothetical protein
MLYRRHRRGELKGPNGMFSRTKAGVIRDISQLMVHLILYLDPATLCCHLPVLSCPANVLIPLDRRTKYLSRLLVL